MSARFPLSAPKWRRSRYRQFEAGAHDTRRATLEVIVRAFRDAGVEFIDENGGGPGVRLRKRHHKRVRQQATESVGTSEFSDRNAVGPVGTATKAATVEKG